MVDPSGQDGSPLGSAGGATSCIGAVTSGASNPVADVGCAKSAGDILADLLSWLFPGGFYGNLQPRPSAQLWDEGNIIYGPNIAGAFGLPDDTCEFGPCGGGMGFGPSVGSVVTNSRFASIADQLAFAAGFFPNVGSPEVPRSNDPIFTYDRCASQVKGRAKKTDQITGLVQSLVFGNLLAACGAAGPEVFSCVGGVGAAGSVVSGVKIAIKQISIYEGESQCLQQQ